MMESRHLVSNELTKKTWKKSAAKTLGRLINGLQRGIKGTKRFILLQQKNFQKAKK